MADDQNQVSAVRSTAPTSGTPEAEAFVAALAARVEATEAKIASDFISLEEAAAFRVKSGLSALTSQIRKENGDDRIFTGKPEPKKKTKKKRVRVSI